MNEDKIVKKLLEHDERFDKIENTMAKKKDIDRIMTTLDEVLRVVKRTEQELIMHESRITRNEKDITKLKPAFGIA